MSTRKIFLFLIAGAFVVGWLTPTNYLGLAFVLTLIVGMVVVFIAAIRDAWQTGKGDNVRS
jgi:TRAP-type C4-dicarboxylate transport system permease large subunit